MPWLMESRDFHEFAAASWLLGEIVHFSPLWGESHELGGARQGQLSFEGHKSITYSMVYVPPNRSNAPLCHLFVSPKFNLF